ncbi:MAG: TlpA disulfide reductase family protein [Tepidisphaeraceae bacterium]
MKAVYDQYHDKGLEVLGVDNDYEAETVIKFTAREGLPWPQLFDAAAAEKGAWNPTTTSFGINGIPTMFLIDKKGVCRSVTARHDFEKLIPQLLAE